MPGPVNAAVVAREADFNRSIYLERRRAERTGRTLVLILMDGTAIADSRTRRAAFLSLIHRLPAMLRDTDVLGWYRRETILGVLLPDLERTDPALIRSVFDKFSSPLHESLGTALASRFQLSLHLFPDPLQLSGESPDFTLYPELAQWVHCQQFQSLLKRALDVAVSLLALLLLSPLCALLAFAVKCSSKGTVLFRQQRLGQYGQPFTFLKFRSMYTASDATLHHTYVSRFIAGELPPEAVYKITDDPRVTPLGRILRRTSLDELPQLWNVLRGQMSLVGPRPPLPYEFERYAPWHCRRILESKPGLTGLWQVQGRSRTSFNEMVRLDLRYARRRSLWLDLKILWHTPGAVLSGKGAY